MMQVKCDKCIFRFENDYWATEVDEHKICKDIVTAIKNLSGVQVGLHSQCNQICTNFGCILAEIVPGRIKRSIFTNGENTNSGKKWHHQGMPRQSRARVAPIFHRSYGRNRCQLLSFVGRQSEGFNFQSVVTLF
jgi:hypothetical protein